MAIFMDRHFLEGMTEEMIAQAHEADLKIQDKYGVKFITHWHDVKRGTTFCLVDSPSKELIIQAHKEAHGDVPSEIIEVEPTIVESFLGRINDPELQAGEKSPKIDNAFRAIMFTDLKDSTLITNTVGDDKAMELLHMVNDITRNALSENNGTEIKHTGDGIMSSFVKVESSINCAVRIQKQFELYNMMHFEQPLWLRVGITAGEPIEEHGDLFGSSVQLAARLCSQASPGQILVSKVIKNECTDNTIRFLDRGKVPLKGFSEDVQIFEIPVA